MRKIAQLIPAGLLWASLTVAGPAAAADPPAAPPPPPATTPPGTTPGEQARAGLELLMKALEGWIRQFPYSAPEVTPDGDIIIRRTDKNRPAAPDSPPVPKPGGAPT